MWLWVETDYVSSYDMWGCPQLNMDRPVYASPCRCQLCQTLGGIYLTVNIEDSMKKKLTSDIRVEVSSCLDANGLPFFGCCFHRHMASKLSIMVNVDKQYNTSVSSEMTLMLMSMELSTMDNIWWIMITSASSWALRKSSRRMVMPWLISTGTGSRPVAVSLWLVDDSCCFCASRVSMMTSTSCMLLYVTASTTFWGGRCIDWQLIVSACFLPPFGASDSFDAAVYVPVKYQVYVSIFYFAHYVGYSIANEVLDCFLCWPVDHPRYGWTINDDTCCLVCISSCDFNFELAIQSWLTCRYSSRLCWWTWK